LKKSSTYFHIQQLITTDNEQQMTHSVCHGSFVFTAQLRLASPGLMHVKKIEECHKKIKKAQETINIEKYL
jgi:hypothetical protein